MNLRQLILIALVAGFIFAIAPGTVRAQWITSSGSTTTTDNVGIGTTSPAAKLDVAGNIQISGNSSTNYVSGKVNLDLTGLFVWHDNATRNLTPTGIGVAVNRSGAAAYFSNASGYAAIFDAGNVGIGTTSPAHALSVTGNTGFQANFWYATNPAINIGDNVSHTTAGTKRMQLYVNTSGNYGSIQALIQGSSLMPLVLNESGGNVGIGTTSPLNKFQVRTAADVNAAFADSSGGFGYSGVLLNAYNDAGSAHIPITYNASKHLFFNGNVGIGTASPQQPLDINGNMRLGNALIQGGTFLPLQSASNDAGGIHILRADTNSWGFFYGDNGGVGILNGSGNWAIRATGSVNNANPSIDFFTNNAFRAVIDGAGNLGLGTPSPSSKLQVVDGDITIDGNQKLWLSASKDTGIGENPATGVMSFSVPAGTPRGFDFQSGGTSRFFIDGSTGNVTASGSIAAKYQDVAEWVPSSEQLSAGTVVVLDSTKSNQVTASSVSYDTRVAGVVSEQPGLALGEKSEGKVLVATTGRVRVKVDASKGAIRIGDLLVTSDVPGVAMKSEAVTLGGVQIHRPGTLIGKALEPLEKGKGEILVLLSLQ